MGRLDDSPHSILHAFGGLDWTDYDYSSNVLIEGSGKDSYGNDMPRTVAIVGRACIQTRKYINDTLISGYRLQADETGNWSFRITNPLQSSDTILASGTVPFSARTWHQLKLSFRDATIEGYINGKLVASVNDSTYASGLAGLGSGYNYAQYDTTDWTGIRPNLLFLILGFALT